MPESEIAVIVLLVFMSLLAIVAGLLVLVLFAQRPKTKLATPTPVPLRQPVRGGVAYRSFTPSSLPRPPTHQPEPPKYQSAGVPAAMLLIRSGPLRDAQFPLARPMIALGRSSRCDITLPDPQASRQHARLEWQRDGLYLVDTNSTHGTYVNGRRITQIRLRGGEQIRVSNTVFTIHLY